MSTFLLELFSEEIPARMQHNAAGWLCERLGLRINELFGVDLQCAFYYSPRRLAILITDMPQTTKANSEEIRGPRLDAPQAALDGFMRKYGINDVSNLEQRNGFYYYNQQFPAVPAEQALPEVVGAVLTELVWPKSMRWGAHKERWVRPLHSIVCMLDDKVIPIKYGHLTAGNQTEGHRFLSKDKLTIKTAAGYAEQLEKAYVICDATKRRKIIADEAEGIAKSLGVNLINDEDLLDEIVGLVEYPVVLQGTIPEEFMKLPPEVLITTLRNNQKYLMMRHPGEFNERLKLAPYFIIVSNNKTEDGGKHVVAGNSKVLAARLADAMFFYEQDLKTPLISRLEELKNLAFQENIGSMYDKVMAVKKIAREIAGIIRADQVLVDRACELAKADLPTGMVKEFPELQGVMGYYYAKANKEPETVALAVLEHYKPVGPSDYIPNELVSIAVALADKIHSITAMFAVGLKPTGSKDPYALRRAAIGIIRIIRENNLTIKLTRFIASQEVLDFVAERFKVICRDELAAMPENIGTLLAEAEYDLNAVFLSMKHNDSL